MLSDPDADLDTTTYNWALEYYQECESSFDMEDFVLYPDKIEIIHSCYLPNAIKNLTPVISLVYKRSEVENFLKIKY